MICAAACRTASSDVCRSAGSGWVVTSVDAGTVGLGSAFSGFCHRDGNGKRFFLHRAVLADGSADEYIARNAHCDCTQGQDYVIALLLEKCEEFVFLRLVVLHVLHLRW